MEHLNKRNLPEYVELANKCRQNSTIDAELYAKYDVKRGLRDLNGKGVVTGLTKISEIISSRMIGDKSVPCDGILRYRGIDVKDLCSCLSTTIVSASRKPPIFCFTENFPQGRNLRILRL